MSFRTHPDYRALYAAVCADPEDDTVRLVLADWLEEFQSGRLKCPWCKGKGDVIASAVYGYATVYETCVICAGERTVPDPEPAALASYIRAGVELARLESACECGPRSALLCPACDRAMSWAEPRIRHLETRWGQRWRECPCPTCGGSGNRGKAGAEGWFSACPTCRGTGDLLRRRTGETTRPTGTWVEFERVHATFVRGFIDIVSCTLAEAFTPDGTPTDWARAVVERVPVTRLVLTDLRPWPSGAGRWLWLNRSSSFGLRWPLNNSPANLPIRLFDALEGDQPSRRTKTWKVFDTEAAAVEALARAACRVAKSGSARNQQVHA